MSIPALQSAGAVLPSLPEFHCETTGNEIGHGVGTSALESWT
ncbi:hypothetical protein OG763_09585 [Streptomyces sp. NBC_01230]|nr:hypothetical protein OG763_09585 [Streptomyces sp. NBC_01230]